MKPGIGQPTPAGRPLGRYGVLGAVRLCLERARPGSVIYVGAGATPAWTFYSTDWKNPERARLEALLSAMRCVGPNGDNRGPRGRSVSSEGAALRRPFHGGVELLGLASGTGSTSAGVVYGADRRPV